MSERIDISFDSENTDSGKIIIDLPDDKPEIEFIHKDIPLLTSKGDFGLSLFYNSSLTFPTGIDSGFRIKYRHELKDKFLNRILFNNKFVLLASSSGTLYFIDIRSGVILNQLIFEGEVFEKTGVVIQNDFYVNSVNSVFKVNTIHEVLEKSSTKQIYIAPEGYYIWTDLNTNKKDIFFIEYNPVQKKSNIVQLNPENGHVILKQEFDMSEPDMSDVCIFKNNLVFINEENLFCWDMMEMKFTELKNAPEVNKFSLLCSSGNRLYIYSSDNMIYFSDSLTDFKPTGISRVLVNSLGAFGNYILLSKSNSWEIFTESGSLIFNDEDADTNYLQAISGNLICFSNKNKFLMYNSARFTEAEGIVIKSDDSSAQQDILAGAISDEVILCLTKSGILTGISNDKLNINV